MSFDARFTKQRFLASKQEKRIDINRITEQNTGNTGIN
jgi:hypothetical protein